MASNLLEISGNLSSEQQPIQHEGSILIKGNVENCNMVVASDDIEIKGDVINSKVRSIRGSIVVHGRINGENTFVYSAKNIEALSVHLANLKAFHTITLQDSAVSSRIMAKHSVKVEKGRGKIEGGEVEAGMGILANIVGSIESIPTNIKLTNFRQFDIYTLLMQLERELETVTKEINNLQKIIEVIKLLGDRVVQLPMEKKQELALKVRQYNDLNLKKKDIETKKERLIEENDNIDELERVIIIHDTLYPGVTATIDKVSNTIQEEYHNVILYKKGILIIGNFDEFMARKKFA